MELSSLKPKQDSNDFISETTLTIWRSLKSRSNSANVDIKELVTDVCNHLKLRLQKHLAETNAKTTKADSTKAIVPLPAIIKTFCSPATWETADSIGKALWCYFADKLKLEDMGINTTVCTKLHQGGATDFSHDDVKIICAATGMSLNVNCKTVTRVAQYKDNPSYQIHCRNGVNSVDAYFVVMWKQGLRGLPKCANVEQVLSNMSGAVLVLVEDMPMYKDADSFRVNLRTASLVHPTVLNPAHGGKRRTGFATLKVLGLFNSETMSLEEQKHADGLSRLNLEHFFLKSSIPQQSSSSDEE